MTASPEACFCHYLRNYQYFAETGGGSLLLIHTLAIALLCGRLLHAYGVSQVRENYRCRTAGMVLTFSVIIAACLFLLFARIF